MKSDQKATGAKGTESTGQGDGEFSSARSALKVELAALASLDLEVLRLRWRNETGRSVPAHLQRRLLLRMLAYRVQVAQFGDLDADEKRLLDRLAEGVDLASAARPGAAVRGGSLKPGTVLVREWNETGIASLSASTVLNGRAGASPVCRRSPGPSLAPARADPASSD